MRKPIIKRIFSVALCLLLGISIIQPLGITFANNHEDTVFNVPIGGYGSAPTIGRQKTDTTSSYVYCQSTNIYHTVRVMARTSENGNYFDVGSPIYNCPSGYSRYLVNYVYEDGYRWACLQFTNTNSFSGNAQGLWSPDSV